MTLEQVLERIRTRPNQKQIQEAKNHQNAVRFHTTFSFESPNTQAETKFLTWVQGILVPDKFKTFKSVLKYPLSTNEICKSIFQEFPRILNSQNRFRKTILDSAENESKFEGFITDSNFDDFWYSEAMTDLGQNFNMFIACDKDAQGKPYFYKVPIDSVIDVELASVDKVKHIIFSQTLTSEDVQNKMLNKYASFDDTTIRLISQTAQGYQLISEVTHGLPYCPVCKFIAKAFNSNLIDSESPISSSLDSLDKYLFWDVCIEIYKSYGAFPVYWAYEPKCNYFDEQTGGSCEGGKISWYDMGADGMEQRHYKTCPSCINKTFIGPGTIITVEPPASKDEVDLRVPVGKLDIDVGALTFLTSNLDALESKIIRICTGKLTTEAKEAINELQVRSSFETRQTILEDLSKVLAKPMWFVLDTLARLMFPRAGVSTSLSLGSQFFLKTSEDLNNEYEALKRAGRPSFELVQKRAAIYETEHRTNPTELRRAEILQVIEPFADFSLDELQSAGVDIKFERAFYFKVMFNDLVARFELDVAPIEEYGKELPFNKRVEAIKEILNDYYENI